MMTFKDSLRIKTDFPYTPVKILSKTVTKVKHSKDGKIYIAKKRILEKQLNAESLKEWRIMQKLDNQLTIVQAKECYYDQ
jgi:hypothetical protein